MRPTNDWDDRHARDHGIFPQCPTRVIGSCEPLAVISMALKVVVHVSTRQRHTRLAEFPQASDKSMQSPEVGRDEAIIRQCWMIDAARTRNGRLPRV